MVRPVEVMAKLRQVDILNVPYEAGFGCKQRRLSSVLCNLPQCSEFVNTLMREGRFGAGWRTYEFNVLTFGLQEREIMNRWADADKISNRIVDLINEELKQPECSPLQMFTGQMLAMLAMLRTAPKEFMPDTLKIVGSAIELCLEDMGVGKVGRN